MTELSAIKERLKNATPGPWKAYDWPGFPKPSEHDGGCVRIENETTITAYCFSGKPNYDALLIAHAPQDLSRLIEAVEEMDRALEWIGSLDNVYIGGKGDMRNRAKEARAKVKEILKRGNK